MALAIKKTVASVQTDISSSIDWSSVMWTQVLTKEVSTLKFSIKVTPGKTLTAVNDQIDLYENGVHVFGGTVVEIDKVVQGGILLTYQISCIDWSFSMDKKLVRKRYANMDPHAIVLDILSNFTDGSFTTTNVQTGHFNVSSINFNYQPVTKCLQKLAQQIGWDWYVDQNKDLHFFLAENNPAPFQIDDTSGNLEWSSLDIDQNLQNMKNSVFVIGGTYPKTFNATTTPDVYITDGQQNTFAIAYAYSKNADGSYPAMTVTLAGVSQTIGTDQVTDPTTVQVLYNDKNRFVKFTTTPTTGQTVKIYGAAKIPIVAHAQDSAAITSFGEIQDAIIDKSITSVPEAHERAQAEILQFGHAVYTVKFNTLQTGLVIGQQIKVVSTLFGFNATLTVKRFSAQPYSPTQMIYSVECYGSDAVTFVDLMASILQQQNNANVVDDSTVVENLLIVAESAVAVETVLITASTPPYQWGPGGSPAIRWNLFTWS